MVNLAKVESKTDISQIKIKVEKLIFLHQQLNEKYRNLESENSRLLQDKQELAKKLQTLQEENRQLRLASRSVQNTDGIKTKLNEYISEIDKCLSLLKN